MLVIQSILLSIGLDTLGYLKSIIERYLYNDYNVDVSDSEKEKIIEINCQKTFVCTLDEFGLRFWPPLYIQRYMIVQEILENPIWNRSIKKVVDYGCAELGFFKCIKSVSGLNNIMLVDIDFNTLDMNQTKVLPTTYDYVSMSERKEPMIVDIYNGSIADLDDRMLGADAVICIELIEHLYPDVLDAVPYTVFEFIKPKLAVFTTPNVEFNILFPNFTTQFRHDDHKFEWTRKQFNKWAKNIISRYPDYAVQLDGIGAGPNGTGYLGCCSQMAIFYRKDMKTSPANPIGSTPYKLLRRVTYPFEFNDENTINERTMYDRLRNLISEPSFNKKYIVGDVMEIPLDVIMPHVSDCCASIHQLENVISKVYETKLNEFGKWLLIKPVSEVSLDEYRLNSDSLSNHSGLEYSLLEDEVINHDDKKEDWNASADISFGESKLCYSTPMTKNQDNYLNSVDYSFNTVFSNSDLYKTAVDHNKSDEDMDMDISSCCNGSISVDDCEVYQDFLIGRNNSVNEEDISETEKTLMCIVDIHEFSDDSCKSINNVINDNTVIQNNMPLASDCSVDTVHMLKLKTNGDFSNNVSTNESSKVIDEVCLNRTLLDDNNYTENLLSTNDKKF